MGTMFNEILNSQNVKNSQRVLFVRTTVIKNQERFDIYQKRFMVVFFLNFRPHWVPY